jgi:hypothetical protein
MPRGRGARERRTRGGRGVAGALVFGALTLALPLLVGLGLGRAFGYGALLILAIRDASADRP